MENPYFKAPFQVTLYDPLRGEAVRSWMLTGSTPPNVLEAARRGAPEAGGRSRPPPAERAPGPQGGEGAPWPRARWKERDAAVLRKYFGAGWRALLTPDVGLALGGPARPPEGGPAVGGGPEVDFGDLGDFDVEDIYVDTAEDAPAARGAPALPAELGSPPASLPAGDPPAPAGTAASWDSATRFEPRAVYPEDTFADLKDKIYAATEIPPYCQHLFYDQGEGAPGTTYQLTLEGQRVITDVRELAGSARGDSFYEGRAAGLPVDRRLEERRDDLQVVALDTFRALGAPGRAAGAGRVRRVFVADLRAVLRGADDGAPGRLAAALADNYEADLLYYGLCLKYWPALSPEAFRLAAADLAGEPGAVARSFPLLEPPLGQVRARLAEEQELLDRTYLRGGQALAALRPPGGRVAVTEGTVTVEPPDPRTRIDVRNVFDWLRTSPRVAGAVARIPAPAAAGRRETVATKRHVSAEAPAVAATLAPFFERPPRRPGVAYALARRRGGELPGPARFVYLTFFADGRYTIRGAWREDDRVDFEAVLAQMTEAARPLIAAVNAMGGAAFPLGGALETPAEASAHSGRASVGELTVSAYWPRALSSAEFRETKKRWRAFERAGLVGVQGLQQAGAYAFHFRKGVVGYDPRTLERVVLRTAGAPAGRIGVANYYAHLTDPALGARWQRLYPGRLVRLYHRTADLRLEAVGVDSAEFERIRLYVFVFLESLARGPGRLPSAGRDRAAEAPVGPGGRRLRALQESDPNLFHPEKYDRAATVYSVLCQGDRQPHAYTEAEARNLSAARRKRLTRFWNFTEGRPAYYGCPSRAYPFLHFQAGRHPLGFCLPCCKKAAALPGSKGEAVNRFCLQHAAEEAPGSGAGPAAEGPAADGAASRHVLAYGKTVPPGRLALPPRIVEEGLLFDTLPEPLVFRQLGVEQVAPAVPDAGHFYALAAVVEASPAEFGEELAATAVALADTFFALRAGAAAVFATAGELADALRQTFCARCPDFSPFSPGGAAAASWRELIDELVGLRYGFEVAVFDDPSAAGEGREAGTEVGLEYSAATAARLRASGEVELALLCRGPGGTYPLVALHQREFLRTPAGRGLARRVYTEAASAEEDELADSVVEVLRGTAPDGERAADSSAPSLADVLDFATGAAYAVEAKLVNLRDMCYGVILRDREGAAVYLPVPYAPHYFAGSASGSDPQRGVVARYGPRPDVPLPPAALRTCLSKLNAFLSGRGARGSPAVAPAAVLVRKGQAVGFVAAAAGAAPRGLSYFHDPAPLDSAAGGLAGDLPRLAAPYDTRLVDEAIFRAGGRPALDPLPGPAAPTPGESEPRRLAAQTLHRHYLYRLFVSEFAALLRGERDEGLRRKLKALIRETRFGSAPSVAAYRAELARLLAATPGDVVTLRALEAAAARLGDRQGGGGNSAAGLRRALLEGIDAAAFDFDQRTLNRLRALPDEAATRRELEKVMRGLVVTQPGEVDAEGAFAPRVANIYVACAAETSLSRPHCAASGAGPADEKKLRLAVPAGRFGELVAILAADVRNPLKAATLATHISGVVDEARFIARPGELITIRP